MIRQDDKILESPTYMRMSLAAAMTLGFKKGLFYRNAKLHCINLLLTYNSGCAARCAYCGLSGKRAGTYSEKSFIRVTWPTYPLKEIIRRISDRQNRVKRICISMITNKKAVKDTESICVRLRSSFDIPVSLLISPTILNGNDLIAFKKAGADKAGVAIDLATPALFDKYRGTGVGGPHNWTTYWDFLEASIRVFGEGNAGAHFIVGMGETEKEMCHAIQQVRDMGGRTHLFTFFPEDGSAMGDYPQPPMDQYRRIQLAQYVIERQISHADRFTYTESGKITDFDVPSDLIDQIIETGEPFRTTGCTGDDGETACNRPYGNSRPGPDIRNYPFPPTSEDIQRIRNQLNG
ncbi:MAG: radical SAM protein [Deltaproteobacteria bacterium]|nr:radical SAM protein [Deltaproteobacteria bacterium]MBW1962554.1 radical SAM protein [Deltaproteobacteria bacterium]MBW1995435.1 radical SAM protein [Deltaproteobacteria bacterium]MBW2153041.1 radical SAM protein [Deltaproteobacteria bacterium]